MRLSITTLTVLPLIIAALCPSALAGNVEVAVLNKNNWHEYVPKGKEVDAIYGDIVLRNDHVVAVIAQPLASRNANMTVRGVGGCLIDLADRKHQSDQLSAYYPGKRGYAFRAWNVLTADEATKLTPHNVHKDLTLSNAHSIAVAVTAEGTDGRARHQVRYSLTPNSKSLDVFSMYQNTGEKKLSVRLEDEARIDGGKEDMSRGMLIEDKAYAVHDRHWNQAYAFEADDSHTLTVTANSRTVSYRFFLDNGKSRVELAPNEGAFLMRHFYVATNEINLRHSFSEEKNATQSVLLHITDGNKRPLQSRVELFADGQSLGTANTNRQGRTRLSIPRTELTATITANGIVVGDKLPISVNGQHASVQLENYNPGTLQFVITDENSRPLPCKIEIIGKDVTPSPNFGPDTGEHAVKNLRYAPHGQAKQSLQPGKYDLIISHGPEYQAVFTEVEVQPGKTNTVRETVARAFDTPGWVSADFHSHSSPSGDNTGSQFGRVLNLVCEHIEFGPCTEHNRISSYQPHIDRLGIGEFIGTVSGMELTGSPLPLNHQNVFPMIHKPRTQDGGGPVTDTDPEKQIERIVLWDDRSEKLVQQNHPDLGWLFFDKNGDGKPDEGYSRSFLLMDVIEIHPIEAALDLKPVDFSYGRHLNHRIFNWLQLLNQGHRIPGVVNTDAHYNYHGSGGLRNWIKSPTDRPDEIDPIDIVHASEQGRLIMSNGPFLQVGLKSGAKNYGPGDEVEGSDGQVALDIEVKCPNWFDIDRVVVLVNGRIQKEHDYRRKSHADMFHGQNQASRFKQTVKLKLDKDAHIVVITGDEDSTLGPVMGPDWGKQKPAAMSNPIFVDADGDGFTPNKDTLDAELPVKFRKKQ